MSGLEGQHSWVDYWFSLYTCSAALWAQACEDMADLRPNQKQMAWLRKSRYFRWKLLMKISMFEWQNVSGGLNFPVSTLYNIIPMLAFHSLHQWTSSLSLILCILCNICDTYVYLPHHNASCLDSFLITLRKFYIILILSPTPFPLWFLSRFRSPDYWVRAGSLPYFQPAKLG